MEAQGPVKNEESSGSYKRCPSSILKVPRKSIRFSESEQQDDVVEYTKPIEKRLSRRVSFAPANDVLLFSKDVKNASPLQNPLQELITSSSVSAQNRVQMMVTEDGNEQTTGMETLLTAPMHTLQQTACIHIRDDFGEKTLFNTDDPFMDMTHCHTIHITNEEERTSHIVPAGGDKTIMFIAEDASMDMTLSQTVHLTCGQEMFSLSKPTPTRVNLVKAQMTSGTDFTLSADDKENQAPRQFNKKTGGSLCVRPFSLEDDIDMTEAQTGSIATNTAEDEPPKCLFSQKIYPEDDKRKSQTKEKDWKSAIDPIQNASKRRPTVNFDPEDSDSSGKTIVFSEDIFMDKTQNHTVNIAMTPPASSRQLWDTASLKERKSSNTIFPSSCLASGSTNILKNSVNLEVTGRVAGNAPSSKESDDPLQCLFQSHEMLETQQKDTNYKGLETYLKTKMLRRQVNIDSQEDGREKTMRFSANDACMDVTRSYTVKISTDFQPSSDQNCLPASREKTGRFTTNEARMDMTECLTVNLSSHAMPSSAIVQQQESLHESLSVQDMDLEFEDFLASVSQGSVLNEEKRTTKVASSHTSLKTQSSVKTQGQTSTVLSMNNSRITRDHLETSNKGEMCLHDDNVNVDVSEVQTQAIVEAENFSFQNVCKTDTSSQQRRRELGSYTKKGIESSHMVPMQKHQVNFSAGDGSREKTVRFTAEGAPMDVTRSHTVNIDFEPQSCDDILPKSGEKTVRFNANDATMDVTRSHTVNIDFEPQSCDNLNSLPKSGEKTVRFNANDAEMDVTQSKTVNIASDFEPRPCAIDKINDDLLSEFGDKNLTLGASDTCKHVAQSNPINIATNTEPQSDGEIGSLPKSVERIMRFDVNDARMEATQCLTVNIGVDSEGPHSALNSVPFGINMTCPSAVKKREHSVNNVPRSRSLAAHSLKPALKSRSSVPWACSVITSTVTPTPASTEEDKNITPTLACAAGDINVDHSPIETHEAHVETENKGFVSVVSEKPEDEVLQSEDCLVNDLRTNMTEALTGHILGQTLTEDSLEYSVQDLPPRFAEERTTEAHEVELRNESNSSEINKKTHSENNEVEVLEESKCSPTSLEKHSDPIHSRKSQKLTLDNIKSKMRRLSQMLNANAAPENVAAESYTTLLIDPELNMNSLPAPEPDLKVDQGNSENQSEPEPLFTPSTPFKLETKQFMSRLSVVSFKPKFRQRCKAEETKKLDSGFGQSSREPTKTLTIHIPNQFGNLDHDVSDINDEELGTCEDVSGTLDIKSLEEDSEQLTYFNEFELDPELENEMFEEEFVPVNEKKRLLPEDEKLAENKKKMKTSSDAVLLTYECDDNITAPPTIHLQTTDSSNCSNTASLRCESTFESTSKQSMFESQLEDYASDLQRKFDDGSLTVMEFFKLFHIDFVIHNLRQSCVPARVLTDADCPLLDLAKDRHISFPKQLVYETDVHKLTEQVERLKFRMCDLDRPLIIVNRTLWEEMRLFSEAVFKSFAVKLKERHNFFRKQCKAQSHQMKEVLYSNLLQANVEEQKKLRGTIEKADAMIKSLDDCIEELEADLAAVEEGMTSQREELNKITETLADNEKSTFELELQKKNNLKKLKRVKDETKNLEENIDILHLINEWKLGKITSNCAVYTFLHKTLRLELVYEESKGTDDDRKITEINFVQQLNNEMSQGHARLVHALVTQYTQGQSWVKKYPTSKHVPQLLQDVSLVVSHCRRLGEELRRLKMWGGLRFAILDISCVDTEVHVVFSSLKRFSKFEVVFSVSLTNHLYVVQLKDFRNIIGNVTIHHIEEIVASFTPDNNCLTKIINKIHSLFC